MYLSCRLLCTLIKGRVYGGIVGSRWLLQGAGAAGDLGEPSAAVRSPVWDDLLRLGAGGRAGAGGQAAEAPRRKDSKAEDADEASARGARREGVQGNSGLGCWSRNPGEFLGLSAVGTWGEKPGDLWEHPRLPAGSWQDRAGGPSENPVT